MYTKDKSNRITLRVNDEQFEFVRSNAEKLGVSPSDFLRMMVNVTMATAKATEETMQSRTEGMAQEITTKALRNIQNDMEGEGERRENETSDFKHQL